MGQGRHVWQGGVVGEGIIGSVQGRGLRDGAGWVRVGRGEPGWCFCVTQRGGALRGRAVQGGAGQGRAGVEFLFNDFQTIKLHCD